MSGQHLIAGGGVRISPVAWIEYMVEDGWAPPGRSAPMPLAEPDGKGAVCVCLAMIA